MSNLASLDILEPPRGNVSGAMQELYRAIDALEELSASSGDERRDTRERILHASLELFAVEGVQATSMRQIASAVGIKAPGLYSHFESKEAILVAAMARALRSFLVFVAAPYGTQEEVDKLEGLVRRHVRFQLENRVIADSNDSLLASEPSLKLITVEARTVLRHAQRSYFNVLRGEIVKHQHVHANPSSTLVIAFSVLSICDRVNAWYRSGGAFTVAEVEEAIWVIVKSIVDKT